MPLMENSVEFNRKLLELIPNMLYLYDIRKEKIVYINQRVKDLLGYESEEFMNLPLNLLIPEELRKTLRETFDKLIHIPENQETEYEHQVLHQDSTYRCIKTHINIFKRNEEGAVTLVMGISEDITEEKQKQLAYNRNQFLLTEAEKMLHFGSWEWDMKTNEVYWSDGLFNIFGYTNPELRPKKLNYELYLSHIHPSEKENAIGLLKDILINKHPITYERKVLTQNGETLILQNKIQVIVDEKGTVVSMIGSAADITQQKKANEQLVYSEALLAETEKIFKYGSWEWNLETDEVYWYDGLIELFEYDKSEFKSNIRNLEFYFRHVHPDDVEKLRQNVRYFAEKKIESMDLIEHRIITKKGNEKVISTKGKLVTKNDSSFRIIGSSADITGQKRAIEKLVESEALLSETEKILNYGSWSWNVPENKISWSDGLWSLLGYDPEKYRNDEIKAGFYTSHLHPEDRDKTKQNYIAFLEGNNFQNQTTERIITPNGQVKWVVSHNRILSWDGNKPVKVIGSTADITQMVLMQQALEQKINDLNRSNQDLEQFAYVASHDLQEPLRKITAFGERLQKKYTPMLGEEGNMYLDRMMDASFRLKVLIESLLNFSKLTRRTETSESIDLSRILELVITDLEIKIQEKQALIEIEGKLPVLQGTASQMSQLFMNLLSNALKFCKKDVQPFIRISAEKLSAKVKKEFDLNTNQAYYRITVEDNGIGFEQEHAEKIFIIFQRLHGRHQYEGNGIGLAICRKIVENHHGLITVQSQPDRGTAFTIILPIDNI